MQNKAHIFEYRNQPIDIIEMKLIVLSKTRKGRKSFVLTSENELGFNIECRKTGNVTFFNNVQEIEWLKEGEIVYLTLENSKEAHDLTVFDEVFIRYAKKLETENHIVREPNREKKIYFEFTEEELKDCRRGLHVAMTHLDATKNGPDMMLASRIEKLFDRMSNH